MSNPAPIIAKPSAADAEIIRAMGRVLGMELAKRMQAKQIKNGMPVLIDGEKQITPTSSAAVAEKVNT